MITTGTGGEIYAEAINFVSTVNRQPSTVNYFPQ